MPFALIIVTVPAKLAKVSHGKSSESTGGENLHSSGSNDSATVMPVANKVREFIVQRPDCQWISEEPFLNGKAWWTSFMFVSKEETTEACVTALCDLGVGMSVAAAAGKEPKGKGMILTLPMKMTRIGSQPKECGHPASLPYGACPTPSVTPASTPIPSVKKSASTQTDTNLSPQVTLTDVNIDDAEIEDDAVVVQGAVSGEIKETRGSKMKSFTGSFTATIESRVSVDSVVQYVAAGSEFSFDYVMLILNASIIACTGLVTNNTVVIVASMLVSPLMGPILAVTFGAVIDDRQLMKRGFLSESIGLIMCILVGFIGGLCAAPFNASSSWPTQEMANRGVDSALWTGVAIAIPSGFGAALSVTGNNTSSLVGVAISASLLPPAVNCGVLLAARALQSTSFISLENEVVVNGETLSFEDLSAAISFCVTLVNIVLIYVCAYAMFIVKGLGSSSVFWTTHVKNTRKYHRAVRDPEQRSAYEQAFHAAKHTHYHHSHSVSPMERTKASWKWTPFMKHSLSASTATESALAGG